jgi:4-diphosphocytidyl-2-C-methyl-D-erythritol kinase
MLAFFYLVMERLSPCKVNLILNILGKRADGFHELETVMHPVKLHDKLAFESVAKGITLTCSNIELPTDSTNLVYRAAEKFFQSSGIAAGVVIHLEKNIPLAAGLGGGSSNAAHTLAGLNELFNRPLGVQELTGLASELGSDVPFFLQDKPALAIGRGEKVQGLETFSALNGTWILLVHPGFGVSTSWAYKNLARFPEALNGRQGRAEQLIESLRNKSLREAAPQIYNSLEAPVLEKYLLLAVFQDFFREEDAPACLMSGSGSTTFAIFETQVTAENAMENFRGKFGPQPWVSLTPFG